MRKHPDRPVPFFQRKWFLGLAAVVSLAAGILAIVNGVKRESQKVFDNTEIVVDSSSGMSGTFDGVPKLNAAADAVRSVLGPGLDGTNVALRLIGAGCDNPAGKPLLGFAPGHVRAIRNAVGALTPGGAANLVDTLQQAVTDFGDFDKVTGVTRRMIVITGNMDACGRDLAELKKRVEARQSQANAGIKVDFHFIGLGLTTEGAKALHDIADATGGEAILPRTREELGSVMKRIVVVEPVVRAGNAVLTILNANVESINAVTNASNAGRADDAKKLLQKARDAFASSEVPFRDLGNRQTTSSFKAVYETASRQRELQRALLDQSEALAGKPDKASIDAFNKTIDTFNAEGQKLVKQLNDVESVR